MPATPSILKRLKHNAWSCAKVSALHVWGLFRPVAHALVALIMLFEEWGYEPIHALLEALGRWPLWARIEAKIASLPPYGALLTFAAPALLLVPVKLGAVYLFATGHWIVGGAIILIAKVASTGLVARIFCLTKPQLLQIGWFRHLYDRFIPWKNDLITRVRASKAWVAVSHIKRRVRKLLGWLFPSTTRKSGRGLYG